MGITGEVAAILTIIFGIVVIVYPQSVALIIGAYLIIVGLIQLLGYAPAMMAKTTDTPGR